MCPSYMVTQGGDAFDPRPRPPALRDAPGRPDEGGCGRPRRSRRRSTSAWPARAARASARSTSTWRPTRPSSSRITTRAGCGRGTPTRWAGSTGGRASPRWMPGVVNFVCSRARPGQAVPGDGRDLDAPQDAGRSPPRRSRTGAAPAAAERGDAARHPLARHVQQPLPPADAEGGRGGAGERRLPGEGSRAIALLRPAALRLRHARHGQAAAAPDPRHAPARDRGRHAVRRAGAELRGRLPRRAARALPDGRGCEAAARQLPHPGRVPREEGARLPPAQAPPQGPRARPLPPRRTS